MNPTWNSVKAAARAAGAKYPEVVSAQWALESGFGKYVSGTCNYFGIKGTPGTTVQTQEWDGDNFITIEATFKDFSTPFDCIKYLVNHWYEDFETGGVTYRGVNRATSPQDCARLLQVEGYATDPVYVEKLLGLIEAHPERPLGGPQSDESPSVDTTDSIRLSDFFRFYSGTPWQDEGIRLLADELNRHQPNLMNENHPWVIRYRRQDKTSIETSVKMTLDVPYMYQLDSETGHGGRMCWSSTNSMLVEFLKPGTLKGNQADDVFLYKVLEYGDTTSADSQVKALNTYGVYAEFRTDGKTEDIKQSLCSGIPVPVGILHYGHYTEPHGGGHWLLIVGIDEESGNWICHDPYGRLNCLTGGYESNSQTAGMFVQYPISYFDKRWRVGGSGGWYIKVKNNF